MRKLSAVVLIACWVAFPVSCTFIYYVGRQPGVSLWTLTLLSVFVFVAWEFVVFEVWSLTRKRN